MIINNILHQLIQSYKQINHKNVIITFPHYLQYDNSIFINNINNLSIYIIHSSKHMDAQSKLKHQQLLIDQITMSPLQKFKKYNTFPWQIIFLTIAIISSIISIQSDTLYLKTQQHQIVHFFNYHLLQHDSFDIYQAPDVFTWRTQQYRNFSDVSNFFDRTLNLFSDINIKNFYIVNQTQLNNTNISVSAYYYNKSTVHQEYFTLSNLINSQKFGINLKKNLINVKMLQIRLPIPNMTKDSRSIQLIIKINIKQRFIVFVELDSQFYDTPFNQQQKQFMPKSTWSQLNNTDTEVKNLQIRKLPNYHHTEFHPLNLTIIAEIFLILINLRSISKKYYLYKLQPIKITNISQGEPFQMLTIRSKIKLFGTWNILMIMLSFGTFIGGGVAGFLSCIQLVRYLQYSENPYLITFLLRKVLALQLVILLNIFIILTGYVLYSMVVYTTIKKFETLQLSFYEYLFNNFQYGIYENFLAIGQYGGLAQIMYFILIFFMVNCANNIMISLLCDIVIQKARYKDLKLFMKSLQLVCPVCKGITNNSPEKKKKKKTNEWILFSESFLEEQQQIDLDVSSPKISPFLVPKIVPSKIKRSISISRQQPMFRKKKTKFMVNQQIDEQEFKKKGVQYKNNNFNLMKQKIQFVNRLFQSYILQIQLLKNNKCKYFLASSLLKSQKILYDINSKFIVIRTKQLNARISPNNSPMTSPGSSPIIVPIKPSRLAQSKRKIIDYRQINKSIYSAMSKD